MRHTQWRRTDQSDGTVRKVVLIWKGAAAPALIKPCTSLASIAVKLRHPTGVYLIHRLPKADNPSSNRKWKTKSPPSLLTTAPVCAKLGLQEMMLPVLCSPPLLGVPDIRV
ncbi:hypothetical protein CesoFtcFv8_008758 [Champsocephalus esox]|uniref:Uncharacterized protein n=2 Tax=Champsocephalus TaxID=52236 RepID=A0AAN8HS63_CHAGU|nr:hypothetical protein CesoFtcFv8_008758 [Champsocephalus esox]KAK5926361.1 hypothetical protein CgunFtcFv8_021942 [Champsocephalus gunnari]